MPDQITWKDEGEQLVARFPAPLSSLFSIVLRGTPSVPRNIYQPNIVAFFDVLYSPSLGNAEKFFNANAFSVNARHGGWTALTVSAKRGHKAAIEFLLKKNADIELTNANGETALMMAAKYSHEKVVECLLDHNANKAIVDSKGENLLMHCARSGNARLVRSSSVRASI